MLKLPVRVRILVLGVLTILPSVWAAAFVIQVMAGLFGLWVPTQEVVDREVRVFTTVGLWSVALGIYYARHFLRNANIPSEKRTLSNAIALVGNLYQMPRYWYAEIYSRGCCPNAKNDAWQEVAHESSGGK